MSLTVDGLCAVQGKVPFSFQEVKAIRRDRTVGSYYSCQFCGGYHITSAPFRAPSSRKKMRKVRKQKDEDSYMMRMEMIGTSLVRSKAKSTGRKVYSPEEMVGFKTRLVALMDEVAYVEKSLKEVEDKLFDGMHDGQVTHSQYMHMTKMLHHAMECTHWAGSWTSDLQQLMRLIIDPPAVSERPDYRKRLQAYDGTLREMKFRLANLWEGYDEAMGG